MSFPDHEQDQRDHGDPEGDGHGRDRCIFRPYPSEDGEVVLRGPPAEVGAFDDGEHERPESDGAEQRAVNIDTGTLLLTARLGHGEERGDEHEDAKWEVHQEDPVPRGPLGERTTGEWADGGSAGDHGTPYPERRGTILTPEHGVHGGEGGGHDERRPDCLHRTRPDQHPRGGRGGGEQTAGDEHDEAGEEEPFAPHRSARFPVERSKAASSTA